MKTTPTILRYLLKVYPGLSVVDDGEMPGWWIRYKHGDKYASAYIENVTHDMRAPIEQQAKRYIPTIEHLKNDFK